MPLLRKKDLEAEIAKTSLGRYLQDYLREAGVKLRVVKNMGECGGLYDPFTKTIKIGSDLSLAEAMHTFAHEARHAAQFRRCRLGGLTRSFNVNSHPHAFTVHLMMSEIDADVFAVYFLHDHRLKAQSNHFDTMREPPVSNTVERRSLYRAFDHAWAETGHSNYKTDMQDILRFVALTWVFFEKDLRDFYTSRSIAGWRKSVMPLLKDVGKNGYADEKALLATAVTLAPKETVAPVAVSYARLFREAGFPSYLARRQQEEYAEILSDKSARHRGVARAVARYQKFAAA